MTIEARLDLQRHSFQQLHSQIEQKFRRTGFELDFHFADIQTGFCGKDFPAIERHFGLRLRVTDLPGRALKFGGKYRCNLFELDTGKQIQRLQRQRGKIRLTAVRNDHFPFRATRQRTHRFRFRFQCLHPLIVDTTHAQSDVAPHQIKLGRIEINAEQRAPLRLDVAKQRVPPDAYGMTQMHSQL